MITLSRNLPNIWKKKMVLKTKGEKLCWTLLFFDKIPEKISLEIELKAQDTRAEIFFACLGKQKDHLRTDIAITHGSKNTFARVYAKAALFDASRFDMQGILKITKKGAGTDTYLSAKALLLSETSYAEIHPELEIQTHEVRASHGSSVGRMNEDDIFYLRSRGMKQDEAQHLLLAEFFRNVIQGIPEDLQKYFFQNVS